MSRLSRIFGERVLKPIESAIRDAGTGASQLPRRGGQASKHAARTSVEADVLPLTKADVAALHAYSGPRFARMNEALRSGRVDPAMAAEIDALRTALTKLPDHHGMVYRGTPTLPPAVLARYRPGSIIDEKAFVSSSTKNGVFTGAVRYRIMSSRGKLISADSRYPTEREVVFPPGTRFKVTKRTYHRSTATTWIEMTEV